jgi:N-acyl-L-homoserine lactone synthetase
MILVVERHNADRHSDLLDQMFRLRARIFGDRLKWNVRVVDGKECDRYDDESPVYIIYTDKTGQKVKGSLRLLPTTGPTVLADCFSDTLPDAVHLSAPTIWECTRFCLHESILDGGRDAMLFAFAVLLVALGEVAIRAGVESIVGNFDAATFRLFQRLGCEVEVIGSTSRFGQPVYLGSHPVSEAIVNRLKKQLKDPAAVFAEAHEADA